VQIRVCRLQPLPVRLFFSPSKQRRSDSSLSPRRERASSVFVQVPSASGHNCMYRQIRSTQPFLSSSVVERRTLILRISSPLRPFPLSLFSFFFSFVSSVSWRSLFSHCKRESAVVLPVPPPADASVFFPGPPSRCFNFLLLS